MKKTFRTVTVAIFAIFVFGAVGAGEANAQKINEILNRMDRHYKTLQTLQADVVMQKHNAQLDESDLTEGTVRYLPKTAKRVMYVRIDWTKPVVEQISVIGDTYRLYRPRLNQVYEGKTDKAKNNAKVGGALSFLSMSKKELNANYTYKYIGDETVKGGLQTSHLELTPKNASNYKVAHLWVDKDGMPVMARVVEKNDDSTTILLSNLKKNDTLKAEIFTIKYPSSIKPIKG